MWTWSEIINTPRGKEDIYLYSRFWRSHGVAGKGLRATVHFCSATPVESFKKSERVRRAKRRDMWREKDGTRKTVTKHIAWGKAAKEMQIIDGITGASGTKSVEEIRSRQNLVVTRCDGCVAIEWQQTRSGRRFAREGAKGAGGRERRRMRVSPVYNGNPFANVRVMSYVKLAIYFQSKKKKKLLDLPTFFGRLLKPNSARLSAVRPTLTALKRTFNFPAQNSLFTGLRSRKQHERFRNLKRTRFSTGSYRRVLV